MARFDFRTVRQAVKDELARILEGDPGEQSVYYADYADVAAPAPRTTEPPAAPPAPSYNPWMLVAAAGLSPRARGKLP